MGYKCKMDKQFLTDQLLHFLRKLDENLVIEEFDDEIIISWYVRNIRTDHNETLCRENYENIRQIFKFQKQRNQPKKIASSLILNSCKSLGYDYDKRTKPYKTILPNGNEGYTTQGHYKITIPMKN